MQTETRSYNVLVVDDEPAVCQSVDKVLRKRGHHVEQALSVASALDVIERGAAFDLVLADLMMPHVGGLELLKIVTDRWPDLPVVIITGYATIASAVETTKLGAIDYLPKPFTPDELTETVADAIRRAQARRAPANPGPATPAARSGETIDVDLPFDEAELEAATSPSYVAHLTRSDMVVVDFCALGQRTCKRVTTKGVCERDECPIVTKRKKTAKRVPVAASISDPIDVDMPFSAREVAAATSQAYVDALGRGDAPNLGRWPKGRAKSPRVLAVDDEAVVVHSIRKSLSRRGFVVDEAFTGYAALRQVMQKPYDLVLLDMRMPDTNGLDLLPKIQKQQPGVPVVIVTGFASIDTAVEAIQRGAADYVPKPFTPDELAKVASRVLQGQTA
jgi:DNA-binding response OmpR family regulator